MKNVRRSLIEILDGHVPKGNYYFPKDANGEFSPIPVEVSGSLFFDVDHGPGSSSPQEYQAKTIWEIHPVSDLAAR